MAFHRLTPLALIALAACSIDDRRPATAAPTADDERALAPEPADGGGDAPVDGAGAGAATAPPSGEAPPTCNGCLVDGECIQAGSFEADNRCHVCAPELDASGWSPAEGSCDDGLFCTVEDRCVDGACVGGAEYPCDDAIACNGVSRCDEVSDTCSPAENQCESEQLCDTESGECVSSCSACTIDGVCVASGATRAGDPCLVCDPARNSVGFSPNTGATCGAAATECSAQDTCDARGECVPNDVPDGARCGAPGAGLSCSGGACVDCAAAPSPDAVCAAQSPLTPLCDRQLGSCVACVATGCSGATPVCDPASGCRGCTEHAECPSSACHLSGPSQGRCFAPGEVVQVSSVAALRTQLGILVPSAPRVLRLAATTFRIDELLDVGAAGTEVAILGQPGTLLTGGPTNGVPPMLSLAFDATLYIANLTIADGPVNAINTSSGSTIWIDDVVIRGYENIGVSGVGEGHIRRSRIRAAGNAVRWGGGSLFMENTALGPGALIGLQTLNSPIIDARYVTIAGNGRNLACDASPGPSGLIRNSVLLGTSQPSFQGAACELLAYVGNAVDQAGFGTVVGPFDASWFRDAPNGDFHLTPAGARAVGNTATLESADPRRDIDGALRPRAGAAGIDQP